MITFADDYSKFVFSKTLQHMNNAEGYNDHTTTRGTRTFLDYATMFMSMPHQDVNLVINPADVDENSIASEISFRWDAIDTEGVEAELSTGIWYEFGLDRYKCGQPLVGALINHGTADEPRWGSHT